MVIFQDLSKPKIDGYCASFGKIFHKTALGETVCLGNPDSLLTGCLGFQFLINHPFPNTFSWATFGYLHCAAHVWLTVRHAVPFVTEGFPPNLYPVNQRISLGVGSILSMCFFSHTLLDCNHLLIIRDWYLSISKPKMFWRCGEERNKKQLQ